MKNGVPLLLDQLVETLQAERTTDALAHQGIRSQSDIGRTATLRGAELLHKGYSAEEVVHEYGNVCQAVTELAIEVTAPITNDDFKTLNRCLDDAIADAVTSYAAAHKELVADKEQDLHARLDFFAQEHRRLVDAATQAFSAIKRGHVGATGATGSLLTHTLSELRDLVSRAIPEIQATKGAEEVRRKLNCPDDSAAGTFPGL
ncbi:MAG: hypothetical protein ABIO49_14905 [Dokdonella sp.]